MENVEHTITRRHPTYSEALAEFPAEYRDAVHAFAYGGHWRRRIIVRLSPALALQLAIDPRLDHARWLLDDEGMIDEVEAAARLAVPRQTRPALLRVVGRKVKLKTPVQRRSRTRC